MGATAPGSVYAEQVVEAICSDDFGSEIDEFAFLSEQVANDPDAPTPARYHELCRKYANDGVSIGYRHGGPIYMSFGPAFFAAVEGAIKGTDNAAHD